MSSNTITTSGCGQIEAQSTANGRLRRTWLVSIGVLSVCLYFAFTFGLHYGVSNQNSYLIRPLHDYDPSLLARDWMTTEVSRHHGFFSLLAVPLFHAGPEGLSFALANILCVGLVALFTYLLLRACDRADVAIIAFLLLLGVMRFTATSSVSGSYLVRGYLQPSSLGALGFLAAMFFFVKEKPLASGLALGLGGLFHSNLLVLGIAVFGLAELMLGRQQLIGRLVKQLGVPLLALLCFLPAMLEVAGEAGEFAKAREAFLLIRGPHHYRPATFGRQFIPFFGWVLVGVGAFWVVAQRASDHRTMRMIATLAISCLCLMFVGTALTTAIYLPKVAQLQPWRVAPFVELLCQAMLCTVVAQELLKRAETRRATLAGTALIVVGLAVLLIKTRTHWFGDLAWVSPVVLLAPLAVGMLRWQPISRLWTSPRREPALVYAVVVLALASGGYFLRTANAGFCCGERGAAEEPLYRWVRGHTPVDALFVVPPQMEGFRLHARRAIIVDWKTPPALGAELVEWFDRLKTVSGLREIGGRDDLAAGYDRINGDRLSLLADTYASDYAVLRADQADSTLRQQYPVEYEDDHFLVISMGERTGLARREDPVGRR